MPSPEFLMITGTPWDKERINHKLAVVEQNIAADLGPETIRRNIEAQCVVVKTANSPELLERFLVHAVDTLRHSITASPVYFGVVDDTPQEETRTTNRLVVEKFSQQHNTPVFYLAVRDQKDRENLISRIRNLVLLNTQNRPHREIDNILLSLEYLLSERFNLKLPESNIGGGFTSTTNIAALVGAYLMGRTGAIPDKSICTFNEDDLIYQTFREGVSPPEFERYDFFRGREILFSDPEKEFVAGKYVGISGNPFTILTNALEVTSRILQDAESGLSADTLSPYYIFSPSTGDFIQVTIKEAYGRLPEIIQNFLARTPITQFVLPAPPRSQWIFDLGNYSVIGSLARRLPFPVGGIPEFTMTGVLKTIFRNHPHALDTEQSILHLRTRREGNLDVYGESIIAGMINDYVHDQAVMESIAAERPELITQNIIEALDDSTITLEMILANTSLLQAVKGDMIERIIKSRTIIQGKLDQLEKELPPDHSLILTLNRLAAEVSDENISRLNATRQRVSPDNPEISRTARYIKRFLHAVRYWPGFFDAAYQLGREDKA